MQGLAFNQLSLPPVHAAAAAAIFEHKLLIKGVCYSHKQLYQFNVEVPVFILAAVGLEDEVMYNLIIARNTLEQHIVVL